jgi:hypothetical protein
MTENPGVFGEIMQNVTDSITHALETTLSLQRSAFFYIPSDYQIASSNNPLGQSNGYVVFERSLLFVVLNATTQPLPDGHALTSNAMNFFRSNARTSEIRNLVSSATFTVRDRLFCGDVSYFWLYLTLSPLEGYDN